MAKDEDTHAVRSDARSTPTSFPGIWQALAITALSAGLFGYWLQSVTKTTQAAAAGVSRLAEVMPQDTVAALDTMAGSHEQLARFSAREACSRRLASVTLVLAPGQPAGRVRLQSGAYVSPAFDVTNAPVRVALPYPEAYAIGHGTISVLGSTADTIVALSPPWRVVAQGATRSREVTWIPAGNCPAKGE